MFFHLANRGFHLFTVEDVLDVANELGDLSQRFVDRRSDLSRWLVCESANPQEMGFFALRGVESNGAGEFRRVTGGFLPRLTLIVRRLRTSDPFEEKK